MLRIDLKGSLIPRQAGAKIEFSTRSGERQLQYDRLSVRDARSRQVPAHIRLGRGRLYLEIEDQDARYPLSIDPFVSEPFVQRGDKLVVGEETPFPGPTFGTGVALSADGNTALLGGPSGNHASGHPIGAAWVFARSGTNWLQQGPKIAATDQTEEQGFGNSVALSADGNTALIVGLGGAWIFSRVGTTWVQQGPGLHAPGEIGGGAALSADGNTALVGGLGINGGAGAAWVFRKSSPNWTLSGPALAGAGEAGEGGFGSSVALSADGRTALVGASNDSEGSGAAWVFTRVNDGWYQQGGKLTGPGEIGAGGFGDSVALSADGNLALVGAGGDNKIGAVWTFERSSSTWNQLGSKLSVPDLEAWADFGRAVSLSDDGHLAAIGAGGARKGFGAAYLFTLKGGVWSEYGDRLTGDVSAWDAGRATPRFGEAVAVSRDGNSVLVGAPFDLASDGSAFIFTHPDPTVQTGASSAIGQSTATLSGTVDPHGGATSECWLEYGTTTAYGSRAPCSPGPGSELGPVAVSAAVSSLTPNSAYHFRVAAATPGGTGYGEDATFSTLPDAPAATTGAASSVGQTYATLNATVNPNGGALTLCRFEYGTSASYGLSTPCASQGQGGQSPLPVTGAASLAADTGYHFRVVAGNAGGTSYGADQSFVTLSQPLPQLQSTMTWLFSWSKRYTTVRALTVHAVPQGGHVEVTCKGKDCPFARSRSATVASRRCHGGKCPKRRTAPQGPTVSLAGLFKGRRLAVGGQISVSVLKSGWIGKSFVFTVRAKRIPKVAIGCLAPGSGKVGVGC